MSYNLQYLEDESIKIIREAFAEAINPVILYSIGKDSTVLLDLCRKAFFPLNINFKVLHVDTGWKFKEMYDFRDFISNKYNCNIFRYKNLDFDNINPFIDGSAIFTNKMKTEALKKCIESNKFDFIISGARRDEEVSRSKERIFSFRNEEQKWFSDKQRPEIFDNFNLLRKEGETFRVFPLSNWTELDIWLYIKENNLDVVDLYFSKERLVGTYNGSLIMINDDRCLNYVTDIRKMNVRFRTLGCYPLTNAILSKARNVDDIINELKVTKYSERYGRTIDKDSEFSMEKKKKDGYF